jgi:hypothetical protein
MYDLRRTPQENLLAQGLHKKIQPPFYRSLSLSLFKEQTLSVVITQLKALMLEPFND